MPLLEFAMMSYVLTKCHYGFVTHFFMWEKWQHIFYRYSLDINHAMYDVISPFLDQVVCP